MKQKVELREARFQDYKAIAALEEAQGLASKPFDEWRRMWAGNPCYEEMGPRWPIGWVLEDSGRVVGCLSNIPLGYTLRGRKLLAATGRGWAVEDQYRGYAPLLMDEQINQENVDLFFTNTVNGNAGDAFAMFGFSRVPVGNWASASFMVTEHRGFAESALRIKNIPGAGILSYPIGTALFIKDKVMRASIPKTDIPVTLTRDFDQRFDAFWEVLNARSRTLLAVRSREALKWHFGPYIDQDKLWVLTAARNGSLDAYAVFQRRDEPRFGLKRMRMVDFQACDWHDQYCAALVQRAFEECQKQGIHLLELVGGDIEKTRIFDRSSPYRRALPGWSSFYMTPNAELQEELAAKDAWDPSSYDGDASL